MENQRQQDLVTVLQFLERNNMKATADMLKQEASFSGEALDEQMNTSGGIASVLTRTEDLTQYTTSYTSLQTFINKSLDMYKCEMSQVLWPLFVYLYLDLMGRGCYKDAKQFYDRFSTEQDAYRDVELRSLAIVETTEHIQTVEIARMFRLKKYVVRMSREACQCLLRHLQESDQSLLLNVMNTYISVDLYDGMPRTATELQAVAGGIGGEGVTAVNKMKVFYGVRKDPELLMAAAADQEEEELGEDGKTKKKKPKKDTAGKKGKPTSSTNAPPATRVPFPDLKNHEKELKIQALRETAKKAKLDREHLPSIYFYTFLNTHGGLNCVNVSDDSAVVSTGYANSSILLRSLTPQKLKLLKPPFELDKIDLESNNLMEKLLDDSSGRDQRTLIGHSGPVYSTSFSPDRSLLVSASEDGTARLWSLHTYSNVVVYKGHNCPVWDVDFGPRGYYFATAAYDHTARLWATDNVQPLRLFIDRLLDVNSVRFHPNGNYIATASSDRTCHLWDITSGQCVRFFTGHKKEILSLDFSPDGRFLASGGADRQVLLWDIADGRLVKDLSGHRGDVHSVCFSREGEVLTSGCSGGLVKVWDGKLWQDMLKEETLEPRIDAPLDAFGVYATKSTPVRRLHFTYRNLLLGFGPYEGTKSAK
ncbi:transcription initiation factor TFIID subunit 5-like [Corticium candelabrum]|uniref:transcription initiation factor TFIID subunit 5-like n=1 Tax=Corticium candelabrum TaxID=121492 RepID=UPI002E25AEB7|nr:transcription initiation factor TFIID subunit 5-like [Corticium candelabrum]